MSFINRTNYTIVIQDGLAEDWEIGLAVGNEIRHTTESGAIVLGPGESKTVALSFEKFYDIKVIDEYINYDIYTDLRVFFIQKRSID